MKTKLECYICGNKVTTKDSEILEYDGYDRTICNKCTHEHPECFDDLNNATVCGTCGN